MDAGRFKSAQTIIEEAKQKFKDRIWVGCSTLSTAPGRNIVHDDEAGV